MLMIVRNFAYDDIDDDYPVPEDFFANLKVLQ